MVSSIKEEDITELRAAGYLAKEIAYRLPAEGQVVPTPKPTERVVFIPHFFRELGFPPDPFVRGLMYYSGIDFHDLSPNSFLNISAFIVVCEAFLRIQLHLLLSSAWRSPVGELQAPPPRRRAAGALPQLLLSP